MMLELCKCGNKMQLPNLHIKRVKAVQELLKYISKATYIAALKRFSKGSRMTVHGSSLTSIFDRHGASFDTKFGV